MILLVNIILKLGTKTIFYQTFKHFILYVINLYIRIYVFQGNI